MSEPRERFLSRKELAAALSAIGISCHPTWAGEIIRHSQLSAARCIRLTDAITFLQRNPDFEPRSKKWQDKAKRAESRVTSRYIRVL